jgi:hypothetical protein
MPRCFVIAREQDSSFGDCSQITLGGLVRFPAPGRHVKQRDCNKEIQGSIARYGVPTSNNGADQFHGRTSKRVWFPIVPTHMSSASRLFAYTVARGTDFLTRGIRYLS